MTDTHPVTERREDWIEWSGGKNPAPGQMVEVKVRWRNGEPSEGPTASENMDWSHRRTGRGEMGDVIAYRVVSAAPSNTQAGGGEGCTTPVPGFVPTEHAAVGWQPIETAPRDGTIVLIGAAGKVPRVYAAAWAGDADFPWTIFDGSHESDGWHDSGPTHWMSLPAAPDAINTAEQPGTQAEGRSEPSPPDLLEAARALTSEFKSHDFPQYMQERWRQPPKPKRREVRRERRNPDSAADAENASRSTDGRRPLRALPRVQQHLDGQCACAPPPHPNGRTARLVSGHRRRARDRQSPSGGRPMTPPSAKEYAAQIVAAKFVGRRQRLSLLPHELGALIALAYDAGVLAQQRFAERKP